jgi:hypothetical protein
MTPARLTLVPTGPEPAPETAAARIRRLQAEAHGLAREQVERLSGAMTALGAMAEEIAEGGEAYPVGAREIARRLVDEIGLRSQTLQAILHKC